MVPAAELLTTGLSTRTRTYMAWLIVQFTVSTQAFSTYQLTTERVITGVAVLGADVATWQLISTRPVAIGRQRATTDGWVNGACAARTC
mmetsp:Transcript_53370/g.106162  ORF Transcript_53370/g.106162 Transcript_53370/m.106162 type:complete len:89 (-) Transcript_53370:18-284(-)